MLIPIRRAGAPSPALQFRSNCRALLNGCSRSGNLEALNLPAEDIDVVDPLEFLRALRRALASDGVYVCLDTNCSDKLEENINPLGSMLHGFSLLYYMTTSLAWGGAGLGTLGFHQRKVQEMCPEAGFRSVRLVPLENPFNNLYEILP